MPTAVYRSNDAGAVPLLNDIGSLITLLDAFLLPLGWTKPFTGTNKAVYRAAVGGPRHYLRVDHSAVRPNIRGFETMSSVDAGTGGYSTGTQLLSGYNTTADAVTRYPYFFVGDERTFYWSYTIGVTTFVGPGVVGWSYFWGFGEFIDFWTTPANNSMEFISGQQTHPSNRGAFISGSRGYVGTTNPAWSVSGHNCLYPLSFNRALPLTPDPTTLGIFVHPVLIQDTGAVRGRFRGMWQPLHADTEQDDTFTGMGVHVGRQFVGAKGMHGIGGAGSYGRFGTVYETTTWDV